MKLRLFAETLTKFVLAKENIKEAFGTTQIDRINTLRREGLLEPELIDILLWEIRRSQSFAPINLSLIYLVYGDIW
ncbi:hypothetical protein VL12_15630 [Rossellomorea marisflavi]|nr:hypothetical protein VL12_15630 [Rossellomorea marisflavi]